MPLQLKKPLRDEDLQKAIELLCSPAFAAMNIANALAGAETDAWKAVREFTPLQLFDEALERKLPVETFIASCSDEKCVDTKLWKNYLAHKEKERAANANVSPQGQTDRGETSQP